MATAKFPEGIRAAQFVIGRQSGPHTRTVRVGWWNIAGNVQTARQAPRLSGIRIIQPIGENRNERGARIARRGSSGIRGDQAALQWGSDPTFHEARKSRNLVRRETHGISTDRGGEGEAAVSNSAAGKTNEAAVI